MSLSLVVVLVWLVAANVIGMLPSKDHHWRNAYLLIALAVPLLVWLVAENGPWWGLAFVIAAGSVLRWPLIYAWRWIKAHLTQI